MRNSIIESVEKSQLKKRPPFKVGDRVNISVRLKEGDKERVQAFRGIVISKQPKSGHGPQATFTVRKISEGVGVERIFPVHSPFIEKIEIETSSEIRRSRLYYLRNLKGKKARLKEAERFGSDMLVDEKKEAAPVETATITTGTELTDTKPASKEEKPKKEEKKK